MASQAKPSPKAYYDSIRDESTLTKASQGRVTMASLLQPGWKSAVSQWGREHLLAHRVVCSEPVARLPLFRNFLRDPSPAHGCIAELLRGPESIDALKNDLEPQIVLRHQPDSVGYVWAALLPFLRNIQKPDSPSMDEPSTPKPARERKPPQRYGDAVSSVHDSSPDSQKNRPATSNSDSSFSTAGYMERPAATPLEDASIRLASCIVRCVLNYGQPVNSLGPFLEFRDQRLAYSYKLGNSWDVHAVDDGGIQIFDKEQGRFRQVALLEGKRTLQRIDEGKAVIVDELLAQMIGETLALALQSSSEIIKRNVSRTDYITILVATHYVKFFHFHASLAYLESYRTLSLDDDQQAAMPNGALRVNSTEWLDIKNPHHRKLIASHLLALVTWAQQELAHPDSG